MALPPTPSQTVGPFFHYALLDEDLSNLVAPDLPSAIKIEGTVYDGAGEAVPDAMLEVWQADSNGCYVRSGDGFSGFGRLGADEEGRYEFVTIKPGAISSSGGQPQAPHIWVSVFARGLLKRVVTRLYFPDEEEANGADPVLMSIEDPTLRTTLVAHAVDDGLLRFDIHLQGDRQTAFFDV